MEHENAGAAIDERTEEEEPAGVSGNGLRDTSKDELVRFEND